MESHMCRLPTLIMMPKGPSFGVEPKLIVELIAYTTHFLLMWILTFDSQQLNIDRQKQAKDVSACLVSLENQNVASLKSRYTIYTRYKALLPINSLKFENSLLIIVNIIPCTLIREKNLRT